jgi:NADPH:quinone reductase
MKMPGINLRVVVTAGSEDKAKRCSEAGADKVILYKKENVSDELRKFAPHGVNVYWDLTKQPDVPLAVDTCAKRGRILLSAGLTHRSELEVGKFYTKNLRMHGFTITDLSPIELQELSVGIITAFAHKALRPHIAEQLPLSETARAHALVESGIDGKVVLTP